MVRREIFIEKVFSTLFRYRYRINVKTPNKVKKKNTFSEPRCEKVKNMRVYPESLPRVKLKKKFNEIDKMSIAPKRFKITKSLKFSPQKDSTF